MDEEAKVLDVQFLTPARVIIENDKGERVVLPMYIDLANRKVYDEDMSVLKTTAVFDYIDSVTVLPEDFFAAGEDIQEKAQEAYEEIQRQREHLGDANGWGSTTN